MKHRPLLLLPLALTLFGCRLIAPKASAYAVWELPSGVQYQNLVVPTDASLPSCALGDALVLDLLAYLPDGTLIESTEEVGVPLELVLGDGTLLPSLEEAIVGMLPGGGRRILVPARLAFGEEGVDDLVPPNSDITFSIELRAVLSTGG